MNDYEDKYVSTVAMMEAITLVLLFTGFVLCALGLIARSFILRIRNRTVRQLAIATTVLKLAALHCSVLHTVG